MSRFDKYLEEIQPVQEMDPLTTVAVGTLAVGTLRLASNLISFLLITSALVKQIKVDPKQTKQLNNILKGSKWVVHSYPEKSPNAFAIGGKHVFITTGLTKILNQKEIDAVLLHEVFHNKDLHIWKQFASDHSFFYLVVFVSLSIAFSTGLFYLGAVAFVLSNSLYRVLYNRLVGRKHEIKADEFAVKYGYGKELISALDKMEKIVQKMQSKKYCGNLCQVERKISDAIDEHPPFKKRVEMILRKTDELGKVIKSKNFAKIKKFVIGFFKK